MTDLATLGIRVESQEADVAEKRLDDLSASAAKAEKNVDALAVAARRADGATSTMNTAVREQGRVMTAARNSIGLTAAEGLNLSRQFADIGVTAAMGMNPLMIALQQGPQLLDIFQMAAMRTGVTVRTAMLTAASGAWAAAAPFVPLVAAATAAGAVIGGGLALAARGANKEFGDLEKGLGLTDEQLKKVTDTSIGMGDIVIATFQEAGEAIMDAFDGPLKAAKQATNQFLDELATNTVKELKVVVGAFVGAFGAIKATWSLLPGAIGDAAYTAAQAAINAVNWLIQKSVDGINSLRNQFNALPAWMRGGETAPTLAAPRIAALANPYAGQMRNVGEVGSAAFNRDFARGGAYVDQAFDAIGRRARDNQIASIRRQAGDADESGAGRAAREAAKLREVLDPLPRIDLQPLRVQFIELVEPLQLVADEMRLIDQLAQDSARGMASAFGETGRVLGDLLTNMTGFESRMAEIALAERKKQLSGSQADRERAHAQVQYYGDMLGAAKGFFQEGSDGYRALQAAEAAWRVFSFAMSVQAMAQQAAETSASVAGSSAKGTASAAAGAAKMFEALGPFGFPVVAAMIALLASLGLKSKGGGGGSASPSLDGSVAKSQGYSQQADATQSSFAASLAQKVEVRVTADRDGLNAYVAQTAREEATPLVMQGMAAASGATRAQVMSDLDKGRTYSRGG